jgi:sugar lactone lactonase YvrE
MARSYRARIATSERYSLAEGIIWDDESSQALWVDIHAGDLVRANLRRSSDSPVSTHLDATVGAVALAADGGLLLAGHRSLITVSPDGEVSHGPDLLGDREHVRFNDGSVDPHGHFVVGTLALANRGENEQLLRISPAGEVEVLRTGITLSNGIGFLADGSIVHADTYARTVSVQRDGQWVTLLDQFVGYPDGLTVDADDTIWVAQYGAGLVQQFALDGTVLSTIELDTPEATCVGFVGPGLLAITTGRESATDANAGAVYLAEVDATGKPENRWAGSTSRPYWKTAP